MSSGRKTFSERNKKQVKIKLIKSIHIKVKLSELRLGEWMTSSQNVENVTTNNCVFFASYCLPSFEENIYSYEKS